MESTQKDYKKIIIVTAPSGSGKTSIVKHLMKLYPELAFSVSATTRQPRKRESDGVDYYFLNEENFKEKIKNKEFLEWEMVYEGKYYGTLKSEMTRLWAMGKVPVLDVDVHGAIHVQQQYPVNTIALFIKPPSTDVLRARLVSRGSETPESLRARLDKSYYEMTFQKNFEHVIVNNDFDQACHEADEIIRKFLHT